MFVGIDIAKRKFDVALLANEKYKHKVFSNDVAGFAAFTAWLAKWNAQDVHLCMEATGIYYEALALYLSDAGHTVSVVNPAQVAAFAHSTLSRAKTDKADAQLIARFCMVMRPMVFCPASFSIRQLQALVRRLESLKDLQLQERNRLEVSLPLVQPSIETILTALEREIAAVKAAIKQHIDDDPDLREQRNLLETIPGLGAATSAMLLAEIPFHRLPCAKTTTAFAGLNPRPHESGSSVRGKTRVSKTGASRIRAGLYMPTVCALKHNPFIRSFYERLLENGKTKMVALVACMRKMLTLAFAIVKSRQPFLLQTA